MSFILFYTIFSGLSAIGGERSVDKTPLSTPVNTTILSSIRLNGETAYTIYSGGTTREKFLDYLKNTLIPTLHERDIVVMDNMRAHHVKEVPSDAFAGGRHEIAALAGVRP